MNWRQKLVEHSIPISLGTGSAFFLASFAVLRWLSGLSAIAASGIAAVFFVISVAGMYTIANNVINAYTLETTEKERHIYQQLTKIRAQLPEIRDSEVTRLLEGVCEYTSELIKRIRESQPKNLLSSLTVIEKWIDIAVDHGLSQYIDIQDNPSYVENPHQKLREGKDAFESLNTFLLNSIRTVKRGDVIAFNVAIDLLESTRFDIV